MALTQQFIESVCSVCPLRNNLNWYSEKTPEDWSIELNIDKEGIKKAGKENLLEKGVKLGSRLLIDSGIDCCGVCGCSLEGMITLGKACPVGLSGENRGVFRLVRGADPKANRKEM